MRLSWKTQILAACLALSPAVSAAASEADQLRVFNVRDHGARGDGTANDTLAIQKAIDACQTAGGGRVLFPEGRYLSATVRLRDGVEFHLAQAATLVGLDDQKAYAGFQSPEWEKRRWNRALIVGEGLRDIAVTGTGVIDGNKVFDPQGEEKMRGPHTIMLLNCRKVALRDVTLRDSGNYAFLFYGCETVRVANAAFEGGWDGVHFRDGGASAEKRWNRDVRISDCKFYTGDDCIAGSYIEDSIVEGCLINSSCNGVRLIGPARRLTFARCEFFGPGKFEHRTSREMRRTNMLAALTLQPSAWTPMPGPLEDVTVRDVAIRNVDCALHVSLRKGNTGTRLTFEKLKATGVYGPAVSIESWGDEPLGEVAVRDLDVQYAPGASFDPRAGDKLKVQSPIRPPGTDVFGRKLPVWGFYARNIESLSLDRVQFTSEDRNDTRPVVRVDDVKKLRLEGLTHSPVPKDAKAIECNNVEEVQDVAQDGTE